MMKNHKDERERIENETWDKIDILKNIDYNHLWPSFNTISSFLREIISSFIYFNSDFRLFASVLA